MKINVPAKTISGSATNIISAELWPYDDGTGDPYWAGGSTPKPYRWEITISITTQFHSSHLTPTPNAYDGLDIQVGDWIASANDGIAVKIISITSKTSISVTCIVEDVLRYNTFRDISGSGTGIFSLGDIVIFSLNEDGDPILDPLVAGIAGATFTSNIIARFKAFYREDFYVLTQPSNTFEIGDLVSITQTGDFVKTTNTTYDRIIGNIVEKGPGPDDFLLTPTTKITENHQPALPGSKGSIIYADTTVAGSLTTTKTDKVAFIQLSDAVKSFADGTVANATSFVGSEIKINGITITFSTGTATIDDVVTDINLLSSLTNVVASKVVIATTVLADLSYGQPATFITAPGPATATFNSQSVTFNNDTFGATELGAGIGNERDIVNSINNAALTNIEAYYTADSITVVETSGSALTIVNTNNDANGTPFAGPASNSGLPLSNTNTFLRLTRTDGGPIDVQNITGTPIDDFGLVSSHNGQLPIALVVEQGIRKGDMYVVADITARNALDVLLGDQAYVLDKGDGEWGLYLATGNSPTPNWTITATEESAKTDSDTYSITITPASSAITFIGEVNSGSRVTVVTVDVTTAFNGAPTLTVGDIGVTDRLISNDQLDLSELGTYQSMPAHIYNGGLDHDINAYFTAGGATVGSAKVTITYS